MAQLVIVELCSGYPQLNQGMVCELIEVIPSRFDKESLFTWPEYWVVKNPQGVEVTAHAYRFKKI